jgi:hypothetical protein
MFASSPTMSHSDMSRGPSRQDITSQANLRDLIHEEEEAESESPEQYMSRLPRPPYSQYSSDDRGLNPANGRIHINTQPSDDPRLHPLRQDSIENQVSPSYSHSTASHYSSSDISSDNESFGFDVNGTIEWLDGIEIGSCMAKECIKGGSEGECRLVNNSHGPIQYSLKSTK